MLLVITELGFVLAVQCHFQTFTLLPKTDVPNSQHFFLTDELASLMADGRLSGRMLLDDVAGR